jgi:DNA-binding NarL/FixJ family response regulator
MPEPGGYLLKNAVDLDLGSAIRAVAEGRRVLDLGLAPELLSPGHKGRY